MLIPAWHIAILWLIYALSYMYRFYLKDRRNRFILLGKGISRLIFAGVYCYIAIVIPTPEKAQVLVRWSLTMFLLVDIFFIAQERIMQNKFEK